MRPRRALALALLAATAHAQWQLLDAHTTASLRGVHALGHGIVWTSGTEGTVLRSTDDGATWTHCPTPPDAANLDFRGIQAFDASTAIVMSSGKGDLSRLYKTTDGCKTWKLVATNPDAEGFWDSFAMPGKLCGLLVGDPVGGRFTLRWVCPEYPHPVNSEEFLPSKDGEAAFAASNSSVFVYSENFWLATGGANGARVIRKSVHGGDGMGWVTYPSSEVPVGGRTESSGVFSLAFAVPSNARVTQVRSGVAVGGDYRKSNDSDRTAAFTTDAGQHWTSATTPPHGYRSAVAYDAPHSTWITVGPNGTDISTDDGRNWHALTPSPTDAPDADKNWNALSLPFVVGPHGRIGKLRNDALTPPKALTR